MILSDIRDIRIGMTSDNRRYRDAHCVNYLPIRTLAST